MLSKFGILTAIILISAAHAESLSYSGRLVNLNGSPVLGTPTLKFELASSADTSVILCSDQITNVPLTHGVFHVKIDFTCGGPTLSQVLTTISQSGDEAVFRVINVTASKTYSFQELNSVPKSNLASMAMTIAQNGATAGQVLAWDGTKWAPVTPSTGNGSVTSIIAGSGLSGGTISTSGTIAIESGGVSDTHLASGISRAKLAPGTANYVLVNNGSGEVSEVASISVAQGGTGANTASGARTNLGLGTAATADIGTSAGNVMSASGVPSCLPFEKLQMSVGPTYAWTCAVDADSLDSTKLPLAGGTMAGAINMGGFKINNLDTPAIATDAATKGYVDTQLGAIGSSQWTTSGSDIYYNTGNVGIGSATPVSKLHVTGKLTVKPDFGTPNTGTTDAVATFDKEAGPVAINLFTSNGNTASVYFGDTTTINSGAIKYLVHSGVPNTQQMDFFVNNTNRMSITGTGSVDVLGTLRLKSDTANTVNLRAPASLASTLSLNLPGTAGSSGQALVTDGSGNLSWATVSAGASAVGGDISGTVSSATIVNNAVTSAKIADGSIVDADVAAGAAIAQSKIQNLTTDLAAKQATITAGTTAQYYRGDKSWQTLDTAVVTENASNLYFTEARVLGTDLAGLSSTPGVISATDTVLSAIGKLNGNQSGYVAKTGDLMSGPLAMGTNKITGLGTPTAGTDAATKTYVDSKATQWINSGLDIYYALGNVGVGTTAPQTAFHVNSAANTTLRISAANTTRDTQIEFMRGSSGSWFGPSTGGTFDVWTAENIPMIFAVNDDEKMRIEANGNVGIGTAAPQVELHVVDTTDSQAFVRIDSYRSAAGASTAVIEMNANVSPAPANKKHFQIMNVNGAAGNDLSVMAINDDKTPKGRRLTVTHDGNVAVGAQTPAAKLDVDGGVKIANDAATCDASKQGTMRFVSGNFQGCDGVSWVTMGSSTPAGQVATYAMTSCPAGWIKANGAAVSRTTYAGLFAAVGTTWGAGDGSTTFTLPDLRGEFVRGLDDGRGVDTGRTIASAQGDDNKSHTHTGSSSADGSHAHTGTTTTDGWHGHTGTTDVAGWHNHAVNALYPWDANVLTTNDWSTDALLGTDNSPGGNGFRSAAQGTEANGNHVHNLSIAGNGSHAHTFTSSTAAAHAHTITVAASGGTETRPRNKALLYCIKY